jgi:hypothetical protein
MKFTRPLERGVNPHTGLPVFGFSIHDVFVFDPFVSECGRFSADPTEVYGLSKAEAEQLVALNKALDIATETALNEGCRILQDALGVASGDAAGMFFSGPENVETIASQLADYVEYEFELDRALNR